VMAELSELLLKLTEVKLPKWHYLFLLDELLKWLAHVGIITPKLVELRASVSAGDTGYIDLWLPGEVGCMGRFYEVYFPHSEGIKYGWMVDSGTEYTVAAHYFIPNSSYVERGVFGERWVKWWVLRFTYEAYEAGTITVRSWSQRVNHETLIALLGVLSPLLVELGFAMVVVPRKRPILSYSEALRECPLCGAKLLEANGKVIRVGEWGKSYSDHPCEVFK